MNEYVYLNDQLVKSEDAYLSIHDTGIMHGVGLFETMRCYGSIIPYLDDHINRLFNSAQALDIHITQDVSDIIDGIHEVIKANNLSEGRLRLTVTPGALNQLISETSSISTLIITGSPLIAYPDTHYEKGIHVIIAPYKENKDDPTAGHKTINYFKRLIVLQQAKALKATEAFWFNTTNRLAEGCISNIFIVKDNIIYTPPIDTPVLPGIIRQQVIRLADQNKIKLNEQDIVIHDLLSADEVFITNSIMEIMPVIKIEAHRVGNGAPGKIFKQLNNLFIIDRKKAASSG